MVHQDGSRESSSPFGLSGTSLRRLPLRTNERRTRSHPQRQRRRGRRCLLAVQALTHLHQQTTSLSLDLYARQYSGGNRIREQTIARPCVRATPAHSWCTPIRLSVSVTASVHHRRCVIGRPGRRLARVPARACTSHHCQSSASICPLGQPSHYHRRPHFHRPHRRQRDRPHPHA